MAGIPALPNLPMGGDGDHHNHNGTGTGTGGGGGGGSGWKVCSNSYCNGPPIAEGRLPAGASWGVGEWHRLSLMTAGNNASASMDGEVFWSGAMTVPPPPPPPAQQLGATPDADASCAGSMVILPHDQMLVGGDYRQVQLQSDPSDVKHCVDACCNDKLCSSWAVATSAGSSGARGCRPNTACCWLKNGTVAAEKQPGSKEMAAGYKPGFVPPAHQLNCSSAAGLQWPSHAGACLGLQHDESAHDAHSCALHCCEDASCNVWQLEPDNSSCWRGNPSGCEQSPTKPTSGVRPGYDPAHPHPGPPPGPPPPPAPSGPPHPQLPFKGLVPPSGWAALVTTLGHVQYDNFAMEGRAPGGG